MLWILNQVDDFALCIALAIDVGLRRRERRVPGEVLYVAEAAPAALILRAALVIKVLLPL